MALVECSISKDSPWCFWSCCDSPQSWHNWKKPRCLHFCETGGHPNSHFSPFCMAKLRSFHARSNMADVCVEEMLSGSWVAWANSNWMNFIARSHHLPSRPVVYSWSNPPPQNPAILGNWRLLKYCNIHLDFWRACIRVLDLSWNAPWEFGKIEARRSDKRAPSLSTPIASWDRSGHPEMRR